MTWQELLDEVRKGLNDPDKTHWSDADLLQRATVTRNELFGLHSEAFAVSTVVTAVPTAPSEASLTGTVDFNLTWKQAFVAHVRWQCYMDDSDERQNVALADKHFAIWSRAVGG